ncbi:LacI family DNA-binding transcriptional regulator [Mesorhizobium sp. INR15]|uniref:LacI family DNA-binding transcriptional regulator n=1 Tax=Mesorhizobium sp. INR15 TaxID=2654248 RepID=UPI00189681B6|nr:LacI family DNA-binding transcriptional regulator [Mesorhizobium sp. INR15]QPC95923.1 LacI family DNA-binding transcriptional regulator [Mesorhizobium sp. INR15]
MAVTLRDVGKRAGVSSMTVSRVINGREGVDVETQKKVEEAIEALDYIPNRIARGLTSQKTATIGLVIPDVVNPFFSPVVRGAEMTARKAGYRVLLCNTEGDLRLERDYIEDLVAHRVEGLLLAPANDQSRHSVFPLLRRDFPLVLLDRALPDLDSDLIVSDSATGARRLVEHLIAVGHRDIAHITDADDTSTGRERLRGYREALAAAGIAFREELVFRTTVDQIGGYRAAQHVLDLERVPTAIFTVNNMTVVGAMQALRECGMAVPDDMALVCFDDVEHLAVLSPFLTVIDQPAETFGSLGAQLLLERISGKAGKRSRRIVLQTDLIVRISCGSKSGVPLRS